MPFMQRLTWDGVALHAGHVPGYPASHGCVRLPRDFAERLFEVTSRGMTVVITDRPRRRWLRVLGEGDDDPANTLAPAGLGIDPGFVQRLYDVLAPGATLVVTDEPLGLTAGFTVLRAGDENPPGQPQMEGQ